MTLDQEASWLKMNQRYLTNSLIRVHNALEAAAGKEPSHTLPAADLKFGSSTENQDPQAPAALEILCSVFGLSPFERDLLVLCAGIELDSLTKQLCGEIQGEGGHSFPTFSLALAVLPEGHWSALSPGAPLRYWQMIELIGSDSLTMTPLRIDERVLHFLTGVNHPDHRLRGFIQNLEIPDQMVPSQKEVADQLAKIWIRGDSTSPPPVVQLCGLDDASLRAVGAEACQQVGLVLRQMPAEAIPLETPELNGLIRLWDREAVFSTSALLLECGDFERTNAAREKAVLRWLDTAACPLIISGRERLHSHHTPLITLEVDKPLPEEQREIWSIQLDAIQQKRNGEVEELIGQFNLSATGIQAACLEAAGNNIDVGKRSLWQICRKQTRPRLENLAQRILPIARWDDLVLPQAQKDLLREIAGHVRHRSRVYREWGFASKSNRGLGISAVFSGASGTGKTMAAEVLANELELDLFQIDLSQVISKYIGETEKNLHKVFAAAEDGGAILLFDEADALFGKRSEVKDSHDRYANIEISYLLQRMESYRGLAILTTNMISALDPAFLRRLRFIVHFPFPDQAMRAEIWSCIFPEKIPTGELDPVKLSQLAITGGNIRNIALHAAFFAAADGKVVEMDHLLRAARGEYAKLDKVLTDREIKGWL